MHNDEFKINNQKEEARVSENQVFEFLGEIKKKRDGNKKNTIYNSEYEKSETDTNTNAEQSLLQMMLTSVERDLEILSRELPESSERKMLMEQYKKDFEELGLLFEPDTPIHKLEMKRTEAWINTLGKTK